jgi:hypothetical protein
VNYLKQQDRMWAKYWWNADVQCIDLGDHGFDRDFYYHSSSTKYYNVVDNKDGNKNISTNISDVLGEWYQDVYQSCGFLPTKSGIRNYLALYYTTSLNKQDFPEHLAKIAAAVKENCTNNTNELSAFLVFYPNEVIRSGGAVQLHYDIPKSFFPVGTVSNSDLKYYIFGGNPLYMKK